MSDTKFTKGEWTILPVEEDKEYLRIRGTFLGGRYKVANVIDLKEHHNGMNWCARERIEAMANANLIKVSPKMYRMLESLREDCGIDSKAGKDIDALLAEARGEL